MKRHLPMQAPEGMDFPPYLPWVFSNILLPCPLYVITTVDEAGVPNAQPNSWGLPYGAGDMQMFLFSCETSHHTFENALATREFVVNVPSVDVCKQVMRTVTHYPRGVDEIAASGLTPLPSKHVKAPGIAECRAHVECTVIWHHTVPTANGGGNAVIAGKIVAASADREVLEASAIDKLTIMETPFLTNRSVDARGWVISDPQMCGIISEPRNFWEMTRETD
jgi:flavin reductase (DIM6/NTAB) family NADH-FMN oxidoreductase RutF